RQGFKFLDQLENVLPAVTDILINAPGPIEHEILRQITGDEIASRAHLTAVGRLQSAEDAQKSCLSTAVAPHQADAVAFFNGQGGVVEDGALAVSNYE